MSRVVRRSVVASMGAAVCALGIVTWAGAAPPSVENAGAHPSPDNAAGLRPNLDFSAAPAGLYKIDPSHAHVRFTAAHYGGLSYPALTFRGMESEYMWDPKHPEATRVEARIRMSGLDSGDRDFDHRMDSAGFFLPEGWKFPETFVDNPTDPRRIVFVTTGIKFTEKNKGTMTGDLTFYGKTRPITLNFTYNGFLNSRNAAQQYAGYQKMGFSAEGSFKRSDFGMTYLNTVGDEVKFWMEVEYNLSTPGSSRGSFRPFP